MLKVRKPTRVLTAVTRLKKRGVEESLLLPNHLPPLQTLELQGPLMGERTRSVVLPH